MEHGIQTLLGERSTCEEAIAKIWAEVLRVPGVESGVNFFDIGGDSLKAMEVIVRTGEVFRIDLPLIAFFEDPTVTHLAAVVDGLKTAGAMPPIARVAGRREFPLSYSQQLFWLLEQQNAGTGIYNTHRIFRIRGQVDPVVLERSLIELRRRHEILQVRFIQGVNGPVQVVEPVGSLQLPVTDLLSLDAAAREPAALNLARETVREPFDLNIGPLMRARLVRVAAEDCLLLMAMHHAVSDGFTGGILFNELGAIYEAFAAGAASPLPEPDLHFTDYAAWEQQWIQGSTLDRELEYWRSTLQGAPSSLDLPTDLPRTSDPGCCGRLRSVMIPGELLERSQALAQSNGTTLFTVLASALRILLYRWCGQADFLLGTVASNRSRSGTERMVGCFVNPLPLRNPVNDNQSALDVLNREMAVVMDAFAHQDCPFAKIVEAVNPQRTSDDNPLFNVALLLQNFPVIALSGRGFAAEYVNFDAEVALLDLRFIAMETPAGLQLSCEYKSSLFSEETVDAVLHAYAELLEQIVSSPATPVARVALPEPLLRQAAAARGRDHKPVVAIAASFTAQPVEEPLNFLLGELGMQYRVAFAPYQQVFQQLLDPGSLVRAADGFAVVMVRLEDWLHGGVGTGAAIRQQLQQLAGELIAALRVAQDGPAPLIVCFCPASREVVARAGSHEWFHSLEMTVANAFAAGRGVHVIRSGEILDLYPVDGYEDEYAGRLGNVPYTTDFFSALGTILARRMWSIAENRYKVIAMDCDQVLWSGCCGESRPVSVDVPRSALLNCLVGQRDAGMLLCLCSRSLEENVWAAFESHPAMPIQRDDLVAAAFSRDAISEILRDLARELGLELDAFIFLHADPAECSEVEVACPEVLTLQVPADPDAIPEWLKHVWAFDRFKRSSGEICLSCTECKPGQEVCGRESGGRARQEML